MSIDLLVWIYLYVCCSMILFDVIYLLHMRYDSWSSPRRLWRMRGQMIELAKLQRNGYPCKHEAKKLIERLYRPTGLQAFLQVMAEMREKVPEYDTALMQLMPRIMLHLAPVYSGKRNEYRAYFTYQLAELQLGRDSATHPKKYNEACSRLAGLILPMLSGKTVFVRGNACKAILSLGDLGMVQEMLRRIDTVEEAISGKLLTDYLLESTIDTKQMTVMLTNQMDGLRPWLQVVIVDYMRMIAGSSEHGDSFAPMLFDRMCRGKTDKEVRLAIVRYFRRYPYPPAYKELLELAEGGNDRNWEYSAVATLSLASYPGKQTEETLKRILNSRNWYVRFNAADSLIALGVDEAELASSKDEFAKGMLSYRNAVVRLREGGGDRL